MPSPCLIIKYPASRWLVGSLSRANKFRAIGKSQQGPRLSLLITSHSLLGHDFAVLIARTTVATAVAISALLRLPLLRTGH